MIPFVAHAESNVGQRVKNSRNFLPKTGFRR